ncbi:RIP metalloprotease RseP [Clostridium sp. DL1XJH146]
MLMNIIYIVVAILFLGVLVIAHEFGHFIVARMNGVLVEEFAIGMGPKIFGIQGKETLFSLRAFPIGGYAKMLGEEEESQNSRAFSQKSSLRKLSIIIAGPLMNYLVAILFFAIVTSATGYVEPKISEIVPNSAAAEYGLRVGDEILSLDDKKISSWDDFIVYLNIANGEEINLKVNRDGENLNISLKPKFNADTNTYQVGIASTIVEDVSLFKSIEQGFIRTNSTIKQTFLSLKMIFTGNVSKDDIGGPISIIRISGAAAQAGFINLLYIGAFISVQFAVFNVLPIPALDGAWIFLLIFQIITRKEIDQKYVAVLNTIGFSILMLLMLLITIKDIINPIQF